MTSKNKNSLLDVSGLRTYFYTPKAVIKAVDGVDFNVDKGTALGVAGETGAGKSMTAFSVMRLVPRPGRIIGGEIVFEGRDLLKLAKSEMRQIRGKGIGMVFQDPVSFLNPYLAVGNQIVESILTHEDCSKRDAKERAISILGKLGISSPSKVVDYFPYQLSVGMSQRVMIGIALSCNPSLLIADEPTSALDVTVQRQILDLLADLKKKLNISLIWITHDLGVVAEICDKVAIMYAGQVVENSDILDLFEEPLHPYTQGLIQSTMSIESIKKELTAITGLMPDPSQFPSGCRFHPRCPKAMDICRRKAPPIKIIGKDRKISCWLYD